MFLPRSRWWRSERRVVMWSGPRRVYRESSGASAPFQMAITIDARYAFGCARMSSSLP